MTDEHEDRVVYRIWDPRMKEWYVGYNGTWIWRRKGMAQREADRKNEWRSRDDEPLLEVRPVKLTSYRPV